MYKIIESIMCFLGFKKKGFCIRNRFDYVIFISPKNGNPLIILKLEQILNWNTMGLLHCRRLGN